MKILKSEIHLFRYFASSLFLIPRFTSSPANLSCVPFLKFTMQEFLHSLINGHVKWLQPICAWSWNHKYVNFVISKYFYNWICTLGLDYKHWMVSWQVQFMSLSFYIWQQCFTNVVQGCFFISPMIFCACDVPYIGKFSQRQTSTGFSFVDNLKITIFCNCKHSCD